MTQNLPEKYQHLVDLETSLIKGPWSFWKEEEESGIEVDGDMLWLNESDPANLRFLAEARNLVPDLLADYAAALERLAVAEEALGFYANCAHFTLMNENNPTYYYLGDAETEESSYPVFVEKGTTAAEALKKIRGEQDE